MKKLIGSILFAFALMPLAHAQETAGDTGHEMKADAVQAKDSVKEGAHRVGSDVKAGAHKARRAVTTLCGDGRHTIRGASGCNGHGGVARERN